MQLTCDTQRHRIEGERWRTSIAQFNAMLDRLEQERPRAALDGVVALESGSVALELRGVPLDRAIASLELRAALVAALGPEQHRRLVAFGSFVVTRRRLIVTSRDIPAHSSAC